VTLSDFIEQVGASTLADKLETSESNVYSWKRLESVPRPQMAYYIIKASLDSVTWASIYEPYAKAKIKEENAKTKRKKTTR